MLGGWAAWLCQASAMTPDKPIPPLCPCTNPAASHEVCFDTSKNPKEEPTASLCSDIWPTATLQMWWHNHRAGTEAMEQPPPLAGSYRPSAETSLPPAGTFPVQAGQVASETNPMESAGMLYLLCKGTQPGSLCSVTCHLCIWKTSLFTFNLTFNHQPHLQPLPSALPHLQSHLQPHLPFFLTLHICRHNCR